MRHRFVATIAAALFTVAGTGSAAVDDAITVPAPTQGVIPEVWIDCDVTGNTATTLDSMQRCVRVASADSFHVDVVAYNLPPFGGFRLNLYFDPNYVTFKRADVDFLITSTGRVLCATDTFTVANQVIVLARLGGPTGNPLPSGTGVLARFTFTPKAPFGQTGFDVDLAELNDIDCDPLGGICDCFPVGGPLPLDISQAKAQAYVDTSATVGCWTVTDVNDDSDLDIGDGICDTNPALGVVTSTIRAAIQEADSFPGANRISYRIPDASLACSPTCVISPLSPLPPLTDDAGTEIDATVQPGIVIDGTLAGAGADGHLMKGNLGRIKGEALVNFSGAGVRVIKGIGNFILSCTIGATGAPNGDGVILEGTAASTRVGQQGKGNVISGNMESGVVIMGANTTLNLVAGNMIGTNAAGTAAVPNGIHGVHIIDSPNNSIGIVDFDAKNVISGNFGSGVVVEGPTAVQNCVEHNFIGINAAGTAAIANGQDGVLISNANENFIENNVISGNTFDGVAIVLANENKVAGNLIGVKADTSGVLPNGRDGVVLLNFAQLTIVGRTTAAPGNIIAGNGRDGVHLAGIGCDLNHVRHNFIGTPDVGEDGSCQGDAIFGNGRHGVLIEGGASRNEIGGTAANEENYIRKNKGDGIFIIDSTSVRNSIHENRICGNTELGIDLHPNGPTLNDPNDTDNGPNTLLNYPVIWRARGGGGAPTTVVGFACPGCLVEVFRTENTPDPSGHGEGAVFLTSAVAQPFLLTGFFVADFVGVAVGDELTTTATDVIGNTSEFSPNTDVLAANNSLAAAGCPAGPVTQNPGAQALHEFTVVNIGASAGDFFCWVAGDSGLTYNRGEIITVFEDVIHDTLFMNAGDTTAVKVWIRVDTTATPGDTLRTQLLSVPANNPAGLDSCVIKVVVGGTITAVRPGPTPSSKVSLEQNFPNPFNPNTTIRFSLPEPLKARLVIYDTAGRRVRVLIDKTLPAGSHPVRWDGRDQGGRIVATGVYFYVLDTPVARVSRRMVLLK